MLLYQLLAEIRLTSVNSSLVLVFFREMETEFSFWFVLFLFVCLYVVLEDTDVCQFITSILLGDIGRHVALPWWMDAKSQGIV